MFEVEKGIAVPEHNRKCAKKFPFEQLEIGDSFLVPLATNKSPSSIYSAISQARKKLNIALTSARVWRIKSPLPSQQSNTSE